MHRKLPDIGVEFRSPSKKIGMQTEAWVLMNLSCPGCGGNLAPQASGTRSVDFKCSACAEDYQLKSRGRFSNAPILGAKFQTTLVRIIQRTHPSLILLTYEPNTMTVQDGLFVHRAYISSELVTSRKPLSESARRAGYQGCLLDLSKLKYGQALQLFDHEKSLARNSIELYWTDATRTLQQLPVSQRWLADILNIVLVLPKEFTLIDCYQFEGFLKVRYPKNEHIRDKIRQQIQVLRDLHLIVALGAGAYRRL